MTVQANDPGPVIERLIRIETKVDVAISTQTDHESRIRALEADNTPGGHSDHENRLRSLEKFRWQLAGAYAAGAIIGSIIGSVIGPFIGK